MKYIFTGLLLSALLPGNHVLSQILSDTEPISYKTGLYAFDDAMELYEVPEIDMAAVQLEDERRAEEGAFPADGRRIPVGWNMVEDGQWFTLDNGDMLWKMKIHSPGALSLELYYEEFYLPKGSMLHMYSEDRDEYIGGYTSDHNSESGYFSTGILEGETMIVEYYEPRALSGEGRIVIQDIGHRYRELSGDFSRADPCQVDVNCPEGEEWQDEKHGVLRLRMSQNGSVTGWCSGSLVNNTAEDCTPYVLSAFHCLDNIVNTQSDLDQLRFYFNYERTGCDSGPASQTQSLAGCSVVARSNNAGNSGSDFVLLLMDDEIPEFFEPYWNGWNLQSTTISGGGVGIHHPNGDEKKISTSTQNYISTTFGGGVQGYWRVYWSGTESGHGVTEGGSSGSPLFDSNHLVVGTLTGGLSYCNSVEPGGQDEPDWYGKMSYHWDQNSGTQTMDLKDVLDPLNTGQEVLFGTYAPCGSSTSVEESDEQIAEQLNIFPNPTSGQLTFDIRGLENEIEHITIHNVVGKSIASIIANDPVVSYDLSGQPSGFYIVTFHFSDRQAMSQKVVLY